MTKKTLIDYLEKRLNEAKKQYDDEIDLDFQFYLKGEIDFIKIILNRTNNDDFENKAC